MFISEKLVGFRAAFSDGGFARHQCVCGKQFYNAGDAGIDWEEGELADLEANAEGLVGSVGVLRIEGKDYVSACDCWYPTGSKFCRIIDQHAHSIARYLTEEKKRKQRVADRAPVVE